MKGSTLQRQMLTYFGLIAAASMLITLEFVWAIRFAITQVVTWLAFSPECEASAAPFTAALTELRHKAFLMGIVQAVVTLIVLLMLIRRITGPLQHMVVQAKRIAEGDLSATIQIHRRDEIGHLGETINGLTSNIQEIVTLGLATEETIHESLDALRELTKDSPACCEQLDAIAKALGGYKGVMNEFTLFPAPATDSLTDAAP